jgi:F-type H+-transporting ATPase subunit gamma
MQELVEIRRRLKTVETIHSVAGTLATVSAAKLSRARERAQAARIYTRTVRRLVGRQLEVAQGEGVSPESLSPLLQSRDVHRVLLLVAGSDQGLCGGYNLDIAGEVRSFVDARSREGVDVSLFVRGKRTRRILSRMLEGPIEDGGGWEKGGVTEESVDSLFALSQERFDNEEADEVWACYSSFLSSVQREPVAVRLLPVALPPAHSQSIPRYFYEPDRDAPLRELLDVLARLQVEDVLVEAFASEQAARMVTMQEATERAELSMAELRIRLNRVRRESITAGLAGVLVAHRLRKERADVI